jgi:phage-related protein
MAGNYSLGSAEGIIRIKYDGKGVQQASGDIKSVEAKSERLSKSFVKTGAVIAAAVAVAATAVAVGLTKAINAAVDSAAALEQSIGGVNAVFKEHADEVLGFSKAAAAALGLSENAYNEFATVIGSQLKNAGVPMDELAGKTNELIRFGADLAAMFGGTTADAVNALSSALKGEMDPIERYGISLNQAALKAEALKLGISGLPASWDQNTKAMVIMSAAMTQGADAMGAFARESDTLATRQQILAAQVENLRARIGDGFLPVAGAGVGAVSGLVGVFNEFFTKLAENERFLTFISQLAENIQAGAARATEALGSLMDNILSAFEGGGIAGIGDFFLNAITTGLNALLTNLPSLLESLVQHFVAGRVRMIEAFVEVIPGIIDTLSSLLPTLVETILSMVPSLLTAALDLFGSLVDAVVEIIPKVVDTLVDLLPRLVKAITDALPDIIQGALKLFLGIVKGVVKAIPVIIDAVVDLLPVLLKTLLGMLPDLIDGAVKLFTGLIEGLGKALPQLLNAIVAMIPQIVSLLITLTPLLIEGAIQLFMGLVNGLIQILPTLINVLVTQVIPAVIAALIKAIPLLLQVGIDLIGGLLSGLIEAVPDIINWFTELPGKIIEWIGDVLTTLFEKGQDLLNGLWNGIKDIAKSVTTWFTELPGKVVSWVGDLKDTLFKKGKDLLNGLWEGIKKIYKDVKQWFIDLPGKVVETIGDLKDTLFESGKALIQGFWNGMKDVWHRMTDWVVDGLNWLRLLFPYSPAKRGPFSGKGWVLYSGRAVMEGFAEGMSDRVGVVNDTAQRSLTNVAALLPTDHSAAVTAGQMFASGVSTAAGGGGTTITTSTYGDVHIHVKLEDLESVKDLEELWDWIDNLRNRGRTGMEVTAA